MTVYLLLFFEGLLAFVSPCILPLLPIYLIYLAGDKTKGTRQLILNTIGFILGFSILFVALGATATGLGKLLQEHKEALLHASGVFMMLLGLYYILSGSGKFSLSSLWASLKSRISKADASTEAGTAAAAVSSGPKKPKELHFFSSMLFGIAFCSGWTPCLMTWLASALLLSANSDTVFQGMAMLFVFSLGLGLPFLVFALLFQKLKSALHILKQKMSLIQIISGALLIVLGILMISGLFGYYLRLVNPL